MQASPLILPPHLLRYGTFCSGIEAVSVVWDGLGWHPVFFSEIGRFPCAVLQARHPNVPNLGDMTRVDGAALRGLLDILVAGTPCQSFSVAGLRAGLTDERGNLTLELVKIYDASETAYLLWENVPGVLSDRGNAFGCLLAALSGENEELFPPGGKWTDAGYVLGPVRAIAWRVLDAQYFGLAQRRRRVFLVAGPGDGIDPRQILFESSGMRRDTPPRREKAQEVAGTLEASLGRSRGAGISPASICPTLRAGGNSTGGHRPPGTDVDTLETLQVIQTNCFGGECSRERDVAVNLCAHDRRQWESDTFVAQTLRAEGFDASEDGTGRQNLVTMARAVRRLTPLECERLMGFPDGYTALTDYPAWRDVDERENPEELAAAGYTVRRTKKGVWRVNDPDGPRYVALGNSMATNVIRWLGIRIRDAIMEARAA